MSQIIDYRGQQIDVDRTLLELEKVECEESLYTFLQHAWRFIQPAPFIGGWALEAICEHLEAVCDGEIRRLLINIPPRCGKSSICNVAFPAWVWAQETRSPTSGPSVPFLHASYGYKLSLRDSVKCRRLIKGTWYQRLWGERVRVGKDQDQKIRFNNTAGGERLITSIGSGTTGEGGNIIVIDDPNNAEEALSEAIIETTNEDWWDGTMGTRLNDPRTGAFVVIQQRLATQDLTGHILETEGEDWTHLMLPMEYESSRSFETVIGWKDPRTKENELLVPERFGPEEVERLAKRLGPWKCNPGDAPILMADLSMRPLATIKAGDAVIGFAKNAKASGANFSRHSLTPAAVTEVHQYLADVVRITLDSGATIRCTPDHRWFTKDRGAQREKYLPATLRSRLARICPPTLPDITEEDARDAGWLAGFFDGEGSVSVQRRKGAHEKSGHTIMFYQGAGRNLPLCQKLERLLTKFGFEWSYREDERKSNKGAACYGYRSYRLTGGGLPMLQRFLHVVQPTKWRDRIISAACRANFIQRREKVVSIEPAGKEVVYGLTTTTGNYVVWGLASANSAGQLQQRPMPKGGGIIKREWWQLWPPEGEPEGVKSATPPLDFVLASLDTAYTEKTENDYSAMTCWGTFSSDVVAQRTKQVMRDGSIAEVVRSYAESAPKVLLLDAWRDRLELHKLVVRVDATCRRMKVDKLLIEAKASGISVAQEIRRLFRNRPYAVQLIDPKSTDKMARLYSVQHIFAESMVYAPNRKWADMVITEVEEFPRGQHDDLTDTVSQAIRHLRDLGMLARSEEMTEDIEDQLRHRGRPPGPLYPGSG